MPKSQRPNGTVTGGSKRLAIRFYQTKTTLSHEAVPPVRGNSANRPVLAVLVLGLDSGASFRGVS